MTVTAREALDHIRHALSTDQMPAVGGLRILNDAGQFLVSMHAWRWLEQAQSTLSLSAGQGHMWLPEDLREIVSLVATDAINAGIHLTTLQEVSEKRGTTISSSLEYWAALAWVPRATPTRIQFRFVPGQTVPDNYLEGFTVSDGSTEYTFVAGNIQTYYQGNTWAFKSYGADTAANAQSLADCINSVGELTFTAELNAAVTNRVTLVAKVAGEPDADYFSAASTVAWFDLQTTYPGRAGGSPVPRLEMWPTPSVSESNVFLVHYRGGWNEVRSDNDVIGVPTWLESLYLALVRAIALGYERDSEMDVNQRLFAIRSGPLFQTARQRDMMTQPTLGPMANGAAQYVHGVNSMMWNYNSVSGPS